MPLSEATAHDRVLAAWLRPPHYCRLRLVARLANPAIGNADTSRLYVFVPDLHLIADDRIHAFSYTTNQWAVLYNSLFRLAGVRAELAREGVSVQVTQMGDLFDLWRDGHSAERNSVQKIVGSWGNLLKLLYRAPRDPNCLRAQLLVGNHDAQMAGTAGWALRRFLPVESPEAFALALHGDWLDPTERLPDWLARTGLTLAGRLPQAKDYPLGELRALLARNSEQANGFQDWIQHRAAPTLQPMATSAETVDLPDEFNVLRKSAGQTHPFLEDAVKLVTTYRGQPNASRGFDNLRLMVIGHTHHPRISIDDTRDPPFTLLDTGAWIEKYRDSTGAVHPNSQISVVCGNDVRIYQFDRA
jgi:UDP-2,3-diacylglucosamine pyrophosphatase LpxH